MFGIHIIPVLRDNYCYLIEGVDKRCVIVDPGAVEPVTRFIDMHGLMPTAILNTHHHADHVAGNAQLKSRYGISVTGPEAERRSIAGLDKGAKDGDRIDANGVALHVIETPGHTRGHIVFHAPALTALLSGDTLFSMGCGRLLEGTANDMFTSLQTLKKLPPDTLVCCGHEYTLANGAFAQSVEPENADITTRMDAARKQRANDLPTIPVTLATELKTNPFLRAETVAALAQLRTAKDNF